MQKAGLLVKKGDVPTQIKGTTTWKILDSILTSFGTGAWNFVYISFSEEVGVLIVTV